MSEGSESDPAKRLAELHKRRSEIDTEIARIAGSLSGQQGYNRAFLHAHSSLGGGYPQTLQSNHLTLVISGCIQQSEYIRYQSQKDDPGLQKSHRSNGRIR